MSPRIATGAAACAGSAAGGIGSAIFEGRPSAKTAAFIALELAIGGALIAGASAVRR